MFSALFTVVRLHLGRVASLRTIEISFSNLVFKIWLFRNSPFSPHAPSKYSDITLNEKTAFPRTSLPFNFSITILFDVTYSELPQELFNIRHNLISPKEREQLQDLSVDGRIILK